MGKTSLELYIQVIVEYMRIKLDGCYCLRFNMIDRLKIEWRDVAQMGGCMEQRRSDVVLNTFGQRFSWVSIIFLLKREELEKTGNHRWNGRETEDWVI